MAVMDEISRILKSCNIRELKEIEKQCRNFRRHFNDPKPVPITKRIPLNEFVKKLKDGRTVAEKRFIKFLEDWRLDFEDQVPTKMFPHYIMDFVIQLNGSERPLIVEIDGGYHNKREQMKKDSERQRFLEENVGEVIRFTNKEILSNSALVTKKISARHPKHKLQLVGT